MASDGLWEKVPMKIIAGICSIHYPDRNACAAVRDLVNKAANKWRTTSVVYMDDITCVVGFLNSDAIFKKEIYNGDQNLLARAPSEKLISQESKKIE